MSGKILITANLERLKAGRLAARLRELVQASAALQRRARRELSAAQGPQDVAPDIRKRFAALRRATGFVDRRGQRTLVKDLRGLLAMIDGTVGAGGSAGGVRAHLDVPAARPTGPGAHR